MLDRLPPLAVEATDTEEFKLPPQSLPPPTASTIVTETFPPPAAEPGAAPEVETGALEVLRYAPEGEIPVAPFLNVTFNQPMVPLGTIEQLSAADVPVQLTPEVPGTWKWLGTQTLSFEYGTEELQRFPMATALHGDRPGRDDVGDRRRAGDRSGVELPHAAAHGGDRLSPGRTPAP